MASDVPVANGTAGGSITIPTFGIPSTAVVGTPLGLRVRLSNQTSLTSVGASTSGEVEDYQVWVAPALGANSTKLNAASASVSGAGASGIPSLQNFYVPAGSNRILFVIAMFEREHIEPGDNLNDAADLGDNYASPNLLALAVPQPQITAKFTGLRETGLQSILCFFQPAIFASASRQAFWAMPAMAGVTFHGKPITSPFMNQTLRQFWAAPLVMSASRFQGEHTEGFFG